MPAGIPHAVSKSFATERRSFLAELKHRNVLRASALYVGVAWALAQGVSQLGPALGLPDWTTRAFLFACVIGFPVWAAFAWFYEFTPQGFKRDADLAVDAPVRVSNARRLDFAIIAILALVVVLLVTGDFVRATPEAKPLTTFAPPANSIVVLPFANLDGDKSKQYFSDGITEELTDALGQNAGLSVIAWNTASRLANSKLTPLQIGQALNVAHILAGSIQRQNGDVRVSVELLSTQTGQQLWSNHYDDTLANIFKVQDQISASIATALQVKFAAMQATPTRNPEAHELYLKGLAALENVTAANAQAAQDYFQQALKLDPDYADAWAGLAASYLALAQWSNLPIADAVPKMREAAGKALALDPRNVNALVELANADNAAGHTAAARREYERAIQIDPNNARAHLDYGTVLPLQPDLMQTRIAARIDPDNATAQNNLATLYQDTGDWPNVVKAALAMNKLSPEDTDAAFYLAFAYHQLHRDDDAAQAFSLPRPESAIDKALLEAGRLTYTALQHRDQHDQALAALAKLRNNPKLGPFAQGNLMQLYLALGDTTTAMQMLPAICAAGPVGCDDLAINPLYQPLRGVPGFAQLALKYDPTPPATSTANSAPASQAR